MYFFFENRLNNIYTVKEKIKYFYNIYERDLFLVHHQTSFII